jgi:predicted DNA-binding transcriptional regulator AlpA
MQKERTATREPRAKKLLSTTCIPGPVDPASAPNNSASQPQPDHFAGMSAAIDPRLVDRDLGRLTGGKLWRWQKRRLSGNGPPRRMSTPVDPDSAPTNLVSQRQPGHPAGMPPAIDPLLDDRELERRTGAKRSTWQKKRLTGDGPPFIRLGRLVRYRQSEFEAWLAAIPSLRSTSDTGSNTAGGGAISHDGKNTAPGRF